MTPAVAPMRIAIVSTLARPVPPDGEGSVELLVSLQAEHLVARGHDVTLYALAGSRTSGRLRSPVETSYTVDSNKWDWQLYEAYQVREAFRAWRDFDVIHCHSYHFGLLFSEFVPIPSVHSIHVEPGPDWKFLAAETRNRYLVFASCYQAREFRESRDVHIIPHGINVENYRVAPREERENYLVFTGRFHPDKAPLAAIEAARAAGLPIKLAGPRNEYLEDVIMPRVDGKNVQYLGELRGREMADLLARGKALLYPVSRGEPFGLVLAEAMASGLPVVAHGIGAVPEVVEHGATGYVCRPEMREMVEAIGQVDALDRAKIREEAVRRFSAERMVDAFERLYVKAKTRRSLAEPLLHQDSPTPPHGPPQGPP